MRQRGCSDIQLLTRASSCQTHRNQSFCQHFPLYVIWYRWQFHFNFYELFGFIQRPCRQNDINHSNLLSDSYKVDYPKPNQSYFVATGKFFIARENVIEQIRGTFWQHLWLWLPTRHSRGMCTVQDFCSAPPTTLTVTVRISLSTRVSKVRCPDRSYQRDRLQGP